MKALRSILLLFTGSTVLHSCGSIDEEFVAGVYVREWTYAQSDLNGKRKWKPRIRDTIFIDRTDGGFEIRNNRWLLAEHDTRKWIRTNSGTIRTQPAVYDPIESSLISRQHGTYKIAVLHRDGKLFLYGDVNTPWEKVD